MTSLMRSAMANSIGLQCSLALRNVFRQRLRSGLAVFAIAVGVAAVMVASGFVEDIFHNLREATIRSQLGHAQITVAGFQGRSGQSASRFLIPEPVRLARELSSADGVGLVTQRVHFSALAGHGRASLPVLVEGVEPDNERQFASAFTLLEGEPLDLRNRFGLLLGEGLSISLHARLGDDVTLLVSTPDGALNTLDFVVAGVFRTFSKDYDERAVRILLSAAQELMGTVAVDTLVLLFDSTDRTDLMVELLRAKYAANGLEVTPWLALADFYRQAVDLYRRQLLVLQLIIACMMVLMVGNSMSMTVYERTGEFGTMRALGNRRRAVFGLVVLESTILGCIGASMGLILGYIVSTILSSVGIPMPPPPNSNAAFVAQVQLVTSQLPAVFGLGVVATILGAIVPAFRASRISVVDALRFN